MKNGIGINEALLEAIQTTTHLSEDERIYWKNIVPVMSTGQKYKMLLLIRGFERQIKKLNIDILAG